LTNSDSKNINKILLTFDVEEFDLPLEYGIPITGEEQMDIGKKGLDALNEILENQNIQCTLFTTANFAKHFPAAILQLSKSHEIASHTFYHSSFRKEDLKNSRLVLENITSKNIYGLRMPRMKRIDVSWLKEAGYRYDSSVNPTWIPGKYNNLSLPRSLYHQKEIIEIPVSVSPNFRIPLFWLSFKNFPYTYYKKIAIQCLRKDGYLCIYFHPWEFIDLKQYKIPAMIKRKSGNELTVKLNRLISDLKNEGDFISMNSFLDQKGL